MCQNFVYAVSFKLWYGIYVIIVFLCCDTSLLQINCFHTSLLPIVSCYASSFFRCFLFNMFVGAVWCVCHPYFSWSSIFLAISLILPPLSPPNGALCCGTSHLSLCIITVRHGNITMSQIRRRWSNLYLFTSRITIYIFVCHCMAPHTFLCALLLHVTEILLWVRYIVDDQTYIYLRHG